jgi:phospholipid/cholesterol/gamma-HCH transport system substrate-binding protein
MAGKIKNEVKIGIMVAVTIAVFILGFNFLRGRGVFSSDKEYYTYYKDVQGLQESAVVQLKGLGVGKVTKIELQGNRIIKVTFALRKDVHVPVGTFAQLASADLISGTKIINLNMDAASNSQAFVQPGGEIKGKESEGLLDNLSSQVSPLVGVLQHTVISLDTLLNTVNNIINDDTRKHLNASFASLETGLDQLSLLATQLNAQSGNLAGVIKNANSITGNLANSNEKISSTLNNLETFSTSLNNAPIQQTVEDLQKAAAALQGIVSKVNDNNGSLGMLLSDKKLYNNLSSTLGTLDTLLGDLKAHPAKYINVSVFGRKAKE